LLATFLNILVGTISLPWLGKQTCMAKTLSLYLSVITTAGSKTCQPLSWEPEMVYFPVDKVP
jgi:hypothetical protein